MARSCRQTLPWTGNWPIAPVVQEPRGASIVRLFNFLVGTFAGAICVRVESSTDVLFDMEEAC
jgi:hypothetical protein